jgi:hypothetical protein
MLAVKVTTEDRTKRIIDRTNKAAFKNFAHAAARISKDAKESIVKSDEPSPEGTPPHTRAERGHNLRGAIRFAATKEGAVIGPMASIIGEVGAAHEFGEVYKGQDFDIRAFMGPALEKNVDRLARDWYGTI